MVEEETQRDAEYDGPWKDALELGVEWFLKGCDWEIAEEIDWTQDYESLDKELQRLFPPVEGSVRYPDCLFKFIKTSGDPLYVHIEIQAFFEVLFGSRTMTYRHRL